MLYDRRRYANDKPKQTNSSSLKGFGPDRIRPDLWDKLDDDDGSVEAWTKKSNAACTNRLSDKNMEGSAKTQGFYSICSTQKKIGIGPCLFVIICFLVTLILSYII